jgi:hypothetical protein
VKEGLHDFKSSESSAKLSVSPFKRPEGVAESLHSSFKELEALAGLSEIDFKGPETVCDSLAIDFR